MGAAYAGGGEVRQEYDAGSQLGGVHVLVVYGGAAGLVGLTGELGASARSQTRPEAPTSRKSGARNSTLLSIRSEPSARMPP
ncbi:hypothetical protein GCM10027425_18510 [Alteromonas gracilis]